MNTKQANFICHSKLESVGSHLTIEFSDGLKDVSLPSLKTIGGGATFNGDFDRYVGLFFDAQRWPAALLNICIS